MCSSWADDAHVGSVRHGKKIAWEKENKERLAVQLHRPASAATGPPPPPPPPPGLGVERILDKLAEIERTIDAMERTLNVVEAKTAPLPRNRALHPAPLPRNLLRPVPLPRW